MTWLRWLWVAVWIAYVGGCVHLVGAQWTLLAIPGSGATVALVPTAVLLPIMVLTIPAQALAELVDPRLLMMAVSAYACVLAGSLAVLTALGRATPGVVVIFTFGLGVGAALLLPTWRSLAAELGGQRSQGRLELLSFAVARVVGPLLAGVVIVTSGVWNAFTMTAFCVVLLGVLVLWWRTAEPAFRREPAPAEAAARAVDDVRRKPALPRTMLRTVLFVAPGAVWWALLPLLAQSRLGLAASGYGVLLAACGAGTVVAVLLGGRLPSRFATRQLVAGEALFAAVLVVIGWLPSLWLAVPVSVLAGLAWTMVTTTLGGLRFDGSREATVLLVTGAGSLAVASVLWGQLAELAGLRWTFMIAAVAVLAGAVVGSVATEPQRAD